MCYITICYILRHCTLLTLCALIEYLYQPLLAQCRMIHSSNSHMSLFNIHSNNSHMCLYSTHLNISHKCLLVYPQILHNPKLPWSKILWFLWIILGSGKFYSQNAWLVDEEVSVLGTNNPWKLGKSILSRNENFGPQKFKAIQY